MPKISVIQFPGSNCDRDTKHVIEDVIGCRADLNWYESADLSNYDGIVLPGGFSYGDYLRAGAIAAQTKIGNSLKRAAREGKPILGICNGFQILTELGLLKGALTTNSYPKFRCEHVYLKVNNTESIFTRKFDKNEVINLPIAHKEGRYYNQDPELSELKNSNQIAFKYSNKEGEVTKASNPNGSCENIAGLINEKGNVLGMMPHPERASEDILGSTDGKKILKGMIESIN
ncbi:MAG: Phosphoribosylformylglycinamidine (FGAM) synthase glutamine amidotransferase domain [Candidatus Methanohalarchaeum thermophilum]|uniref:Phosphoribosylformylglycinamidine synthase subunit PurQ n=1 Tax=Methanohalarchaeum thermophilum TaxID=1903181 RepID=A0A1Q6DTJ6_METT1|nr:MAG: Phosphoribosylformylglycinamidine (FGAM) synthase glutamine amidotransferase domain [Candidatus Methanohalarchaeum thermophilum]